MVYGLIFTENILEKFYDEPLLFGGWYYIYILWYALILDRPRAC